MVDLESRIQQAIEDITGNEALLEMLETEAATEMQNWGKSMVTTVINRSRDLDEAALDVRLKAVRQFMRSAGNWAAGKYSDPADRTQLRDKLLGQYKVIQGADTNLPSPEQMDAVLNPVDEPGNSQHQLILNLKNLLNEPH